jgi:hypothetical protein
MEQAFRVEFNQGGDTRIGSMVFVSPQKMCFVEDDGKSDKKEEIVLDNVEALKQEGLVVCLRYEKQELRIKVKRLKKKKKKKNLKVFFS